MSGRSVEMQEMSGSWLMTGVPFDKQGNPLYKKTEEMTSEEVREKLKEGEIAGIVTTGDPVARNMWRTILADCLSIYAEERGVLYRDFLRVLGKMPIERVPAGVRVIVPWETTRKGVGFARGIIVRDKGIE